MTTTSKSTIPVILQISSSDQSLTVLSDSSTKNSRSTTSSSSSSASNRGFHRSDTDPFATPSPTESSSRSKVSSLFSTLNISPSSTCCQRRMSTAVATAPDAEHELLEGRPRVVFSANKRPSFLQRVGQRSPVPSSKQAMTQSPPLLHRSSTAPINMCLADYLIHPAPLRMEYWSDPAASAFNVRGSTYMTDRIKQCSEASVFQLLTVDLIKVNHPILSGICSHPNERIQLALQREAETGTKELPAFIFCVNYIIPGAASCESNNNDCFFHWVAYFGTDDVAMLRDVSTPLGRLTEPFFFGDSDEFRNNTFKLIPRIVEGNFVIRKAVGSKPTLLGRKLRQHYIRDTSSSSPRFFELMVDIASDPVADRMVKLALGSAKTLVVDMMFMLEGDSERTLPERILAGARIEHLDFKRPDLQRCVSTSGR